MVEAVGDGAGVQPGERVYAVLFPAGGGFAELALASADRLAPMPGKASFVEAAGLVIGAGTAYEGLIDRGAAPRPGKVCSLPPRRAAWAAPRCRSRPPWAPAW